MLIVPHARPITVKSPSSILQDSHEPAQSVTFSFVHQSHRRLRRLLPRCYPRSRKVWSSLKEHGIASTKKSCHNCVVSMRDHVMLFPRNYKMSLCSYFYSILCLSQFEFPLPFCNTVHQSHLHTHHVQINRTSMPCRTRCSWSKCQAQ